MRTLLHYVRHWPGAPTTVRRLHEQRGVPRLQRIGSSRPAGGGNHGAVVAKRRWQRVVIAPFRTAADRLRRERDPDAFNALDATVELGVGKNMVKAIRFWGTAAKLIEQSPNSPNKQSADAVHKKSLRHYAEVVEGSGTLFGHAIVGSQPQFGGDVSYCAGERATTTWFSGIDEDLVMMRNGRRPTSSTPPHQTSPR